MTATAPANFGARKKSAVTITLLDGPAIAVEIPKIECLVSDIGLVAGGGAPHLGAGFGFSGKTLAFQSLALSLAAGRPVWGAYRGRSARVLHVDMEQGDRLTRRRYQRLAAAMGIELGSLGDALSLAVMPPISLTRDHFAAWREIMTGRDLVIVDSLRAATAGIDENSSEIRGCLDMLGEASEATQCRPALIHHSRKPNKDDPGGRYAIRGSGSIYDACDCVYLFSAAKGEPVSVEQAKARTQGDSIPDFALVISDVEIDGDPRGGLRVQVHGHELVEERRREVAEQRHRTELGFDCTQLRRVLAENPGINVTDLRSAMRPAGKDRVANALRAMRGEIEMREERAGRTTTVRHYLRGPQS